jgi:hypothetical protein
MAFRISKQYNAYLFDRLILIVIVIRYMIVARKKDLATQHLINADSGQILVHIYGRDVPFFKSTHFLKKG